MKKITLLSFACFLIFSKQILSAQNVAINSTGNAPNSSAMLDVQSTTKGMLIPRMTTAQRTAIASPATGLLVYDNTTNSFWFKNDTKWVELTGNSDGTWTKNASDVYVNNGENVGIGTNNPSVRLQVGNGTDVTKTSGGYLQLGSPSSTNLALDNNEIQARDDSNFSDLSLQASGGNVGIGTKNPEVRLQISNGTDASTVGGYLQLGEETVPNLALDNNEIQARNDGNASTLYLQHSGGNLDIGSSAIGTPAANLDIVNGKLIKPNTGNYNMMPLCYGHINANGSIAVATANVSVTRASAGTYEIKCAGITSNSIMIVSMYDNLQYIGGPKYISDGRMDVYIQNIKDVIDDPGGFQTNDDKAFYFVIYNP